MHIPAHGSAQDHTAAPSITQQRTVAHRSTQPAMGQRPGRPKGQNINSNIRGQLQHQPSLGTCPCPRGNSTCRPGSTCSCSDAARAAHERCTDGGAGRRPCQHHHPIWEPGAQLRSCRHQTRCTLSRRRTPPASCSPSSAAAQCSARSAVLLPGSLALASGTCTPKSTLSRDCNCRLLTP